MADAKKVITSVHKISGQLLSDEATLFANDRGQLVQVPVSSFGFSGSSLDPKALHFKGVITSLPDSTSGYTDGDVIIVGEKEYVLYLDEWYEFGNTSVSDVIEVEEITADEISDIFGTLSL